LSSKLRKLVMQTLGAKGGKGCRRDLLIPTACDRLVVDYWFVFVD
jgi:hypothetical protein